MTEKGAEKISDVITSTYKVPGGKLVRLRAKVVGGKLSSVQLSGDFFLMPPEKLPLLENFLNGWDLSFPNNSDQLQNRLDKFLAREQIALSGFNSQTIVQVVAELDKTAKGEK